MEFPNPPQCGLDPTRIMCYCLSVMIGSELDVCCNVPDSITHYMCVQYMYCEDVEKTKSFLCWCAVCMCLVAVTIATKFTTPNSVGAGVDRGSLVC